MSIVEVIRLRMFFRLFALLLASLAPTQANALESEDLRMVIAQLSETWASACVRIPLGSYEFSSQASSAPSTEGVLSFKQAENVAAWAETGVVKAIFSNRAGEPVPGIQADGGKLVVELLAVDDPSIQMDQDDNSICVTQGTFGDFHPTSIVPVTLDDGRRGRIHFFTYRANWSPFVSQRYGLDARRRAAVLVSFDPRQGWDRIEDFRTENEGHKFSPDIFSHAGLSRFDFEATHPDTIEILDVPPGYPATARELTVRYKTPVPAAAASCRELDPWEVPACIENLAQSGAILGALSVCSRNDTDCLVDLLYASEPHHIADWCQAGPNDLPRCQAFAALHGSQSEPAEALPQWPVAKLVRSQDADNGTAFFLRARSIEYGPLKKLERSDRRRNAGTPYLKLSCNEGQLAASMLYAAHSPLWQPGQEVAVTVEGRLDKDNDFTLLAGSDGTTLSVDGKQVEKFIRHTLSSERFSLTTSGGESTRTHITLRRRGTVTIGDVVKDINDGVYNLPSLLSAAGCDQAIERALQ